MKARRRATYRILAWSAMLGLTAAVAARSTIDDRLPFGPLVFAWMALCAYRIYQWVDTLIDINRRNPHGRHRQAAADHRDPPPDPGAGAGAGPGYAYRPTGTGAFRTRPGVSATVWGGYRTTPAQIPPLVASPTLVASTNVLLSRHEERPGEVVPGNVPILAKREAYLRLSLGGRTVTGFGSKFSSVEFGVKATARCRWKEEPVPYSHDGGVPDWGCTCGFYSWKLDQPVPMWRAWHPRVGASPSFLCLLLVELTGRVIEHEEGYRAEHQRVLEVQLPPTATDLDLLWSPVPVIKAGEERWWAK